MKTRKHIKAQLEAAFKRIDELGDELFYAADLAEIDDALKSEHTMCLLSPAERKHPLDVLFRTGTGYEDDEHVEYWTNLRAMICLEGADEKRLGPVRDALRALADEIDASIVKWTSRREGG